MLLNVPNPPTTTYTRADLAREIAALAKQMEAVAFKMRYYGGFNPTLLTHSRELSGAAKSARSWARGVRKKTIKTK